MENSSLRFLKDYDVIEILNKEVPKSREKFAREFHLNLYNDYLNNNDNYYNKIYIDNTLSKMTQTRILNEKVSLVESIYPFYQCPITKTLKVSHAIETYEEYLDGDVLLCGTISNGAQCMCDVCYYEL